MGRGIAYQWPYFMLYDEDHFQIAFGDEENPTYEWDDAGFRDFQHDIMTAFDGQEVSRQAGYIPYHRDARYFAENDRLMIGIDSGGGSPCIFVTPKTSVDEDGENEKEYEIAEEVSKAFNSLIRTYGEGFFSRPTSAWTSQPLASY